MDYKPRPILSKPTLNKTYKKKRIFWLNANFNDGFTVINNKIIDISFNVPPFQIYNNNNMRVISYIRNDTNVQPIVIKLKEPYCDSRLITNTDKEGNPIIYVNHTGVEGMTSMSPTFLLMPQQIPRFVFRLDDNLTRQEGLTVATVRDYNYYFSSLTNGTLNSIIGTNFKYITFNSSGSFTLANNLKVDIFMIGGGGGGGYDRASGGGAGAAIIALNQTFNTGTYTITIGAGGAGGTSYTTTPSGQDSQIILSGSAIFRAKGGGGGGSIGIQPSDGGCGGGANCQFIGVGGAAVNTNVINGITVNANSSTSTYATFGNKGGDNNNPFTGGNFSELDGAGGGGIGAAGENNQTTPNAPGKGGNGLATATIGGTVYNLKGYFSPNSSFGVESSSLFYIGGGGGGGNATTGPGGGSGGLGGGGAGGEQGSAGSSGIANTGGGGGGGGGGAQNGGSGGSGIVIIRFLEDYLPPSFMLGLELEDIDMKKDNIVSIYR